MERTVKLPVYAESAKSDVAQGKLADNKDISLQLAKKAAQLEEEKSKTIELLKTIVQLRESLKQEQAKSAELEAKVNRLAVVEENQLARKNVQLEEEKKKSLEYIRTIEQLRESIKQDQARMAAMANMSAELQAKTKELAAMQVKARDLSAALNKISGIAAAGELAGDT